MFKWKYAYPWAPLGNFYPLGIYLTTPFYMHNLAIDTVSTSIVTTLIGKFQIGCLKIFQGDPPGISVIFG